MKLDKSNLTNDLLQAGSVTYGGTLVLSNLSASVEIGDRFKLFSAASYAGKFTSILPSIPRAGRAWDTNSLTSGVLGVIAAPTPPPQVGFGLSGTNLVIGGTSTLYSVTCYLLASTNLALPLANWTPVATNGFDSSGALSLTIGLDPNSPQTFFRLCVP
jgi:hypothetical protein